MCLVFGFDVLLILGYDTRFLFLGVGVLGCFGWLLCGWVSCTGVEVLGLWVLRVSGWCFGLVSWFGSSWLRVVGCLRDFCCLNLWGWCISWGSFGWVA